MHAGGVASVIVVSFEGEVVRTGKRPVNLERVSATYFWFSRPALGGSVGVTTR